MGIVTSSIDKLKKDCFVQDIQPIPVDPIPVTLVGLDSAGKTTLLYKLQFGRIIETQPSKINTEVVLIPRSNVRLCFSDLAGQEKCRNAWPLYSKRAFGCIYVVDISDRDRFDRAAEELHTMLKSTTHKNFVVLILFNKVDLDEADMTGDPTLVQKFKPKNPEHIYRFGYCSLLIDDIAYSEELFWFSTTVMRQVLNQSPSSP